MPTKPPSSQKTKQTLVWSDEELHARIAQMAHDDYISRAELMRRLAAAEWDRRARRAVAKGSSRD